MHNLSSVGKRYLATYIFDYVNGDLTTTQAKTYMSLCFYHRSLKEKQDTYRVANERVYEYDYDAKCYIFVGKLNGESLENFINELLRLEGENRK